MNKGREEESPNRQRKASVTSGSSGNEPKSPLKTILKTEKSPAKPNRRVSINFDFNNENVAESRSNLIHSFGQAKNKKAEKNPGLEEIANMLDHSNMELAPPDVKMMERVIREQAMDPSFFCSSKLREELWRKLEEYAEGQKKIIEKDLNHYEEIAKLKKELYDKTVEVEHLKKILSDKESVYEANIKLVSEMNKLYDKIEGEKFNFEELMHKYTLAQDQIRVLVEENEKLAKGAQEMNSMLNLRIEEFEREKLNLYDAIGKLQNQRLSRLKETDVYEEKGASSYEVKGQSKKYDFQGIMLRLKSTSFNADKYAEVLEIICELHRDLHLEIEESRKQSATGKPEKALEEKNRALIETIRHKQNYRLYLKGLAASNHKVLYSTLALIKEIGDIGGYVDEFVESNATVTLMRTFRKNQNRELRAKVLTILTPLAEISQDLCIEFKNIGIIEILINEMLANTKGFNILSGFLKDLLKMTLAFLRRKISVDQFQRDSMIDFYMKILVETPDLEIKESILEIIMFVSESDVARERLREKDCFTEVMKLMKESYESSNKSMLDKAIGSLAHFTNEKSYRILITESHEHFDTFKILLRSADRTYNAPGATRYSAIGMIRRLSEFNDTQKTRQYILVSGLLPHLVNIFQDEEEEIILEALTTLQTFESFFETYTDGIRSLCKPLVGLLRVKEKFENGRREYETDQTKEVLIKVYKILKKMTNIPLVRAELLSVGMVSKASKLIGISVEKQQHDLVVSAGFLLLGILSEPLSRQEILKERLMLNLMPYYNSDSKEVAHLWHESMCEFLNLREFRAQLEKEINYLAFIKSAIAKPRREFSEELIFMLRVLFQSGKILEAYADPISIPTLFDFYYKTITDTKYPIEFESLIFALQTIRTLSEAPVTRSHLIKNTSMHEVILYAITLNSNDTANEAAEILLNLFKLCSPEELKIFEQDTCAAAIATFSLTSDPTGQTLVYRLCDNIAMKSPIILEKLKKYKVPNVFFDPTKNMPLADPKADAQYAARKAQFENVAVKIGEAADVIGAGKGAYQNRFSKIMDNKVKAKANVVRSARNAAESRVSTLPAENQAQVPINQGAGNNPIMHSTNNGMNSSGVPGQTNSRLSRRGSHLSDSGLQHESASQAPELRRNVMNDPNSGQNPFNQFRRSGQEGERRTGEPNPSQNMSASLNGNVNISGNGQGTGSNSNSNGFSANGGTRNQNESNGHQPAAPQTGNERQPSNRPNGGSVPSQMNPAGNSMARNQEAPFSPNNEASSYRRPEMNPNPAGNSANQPPKPASRSDFLDRVSNGNREANGKSRSSIPPK